MADDAGPIDGAATPDDERPPLQLRSSADLTGTPVLAVPVGATEQHGPHLPLGTDTLVAEALAQRLARLRPEVVVAPAIPYGASGEHAGFPGTLSIGQAALELVLVELARSADHFAGVVFVCGHGGNATPLRSAVGTLTAEGRRVLAWHPRVVGGDAHAGRTETSIVLALRPDLVGAGSPGNTEALARLWPRLIAGGVASVSPSGVLGDPSGATAEEGGAILDDLLADLAARFDRWQGAPPDG